MTKAHLAVGGRQRYKTSTITLKLLFSIYCSPAVFKCPHTSGHMRCTHSCRLHRARQHVIRLTAGGKQLLSKLTTEEENSVGSTSRRINREDSSVVGVLMSCSVRSRNAVRLLRSQSARVSLSSDVTEVMIDVSV